MLPQTYMKRLDNKRQAWYNNRKGKPGKGIPVMFTKQNLILNKDVVGDENSAYRESAQRTLNRVAAIAKAVKKTWEEFKFEGDLPPPVLAGGAVRDMIIGIAPRDYDVFISLPQGLDKDEKDDLCLLFSKKVAEILGEDKEIPFLLGADALVIDEEAYPAEEVVTESGETKKPWRVYESYVRGLNTVFQIIQRDDYETPDQLIATFDYNIVKGYINCLDGEVHLSDELVDGFNRKRIDIDYSEKKAQHRVDSFLWRVRNYPFKFERNWIGTPPTKKTGKVYVKHPEGYTTEQIDDMIFRQVMNAEPAVDNF